ARIARQKTVFAQRRPQLRIEQRKRAREPHAYRSGLPAYAAALHLRPNFELIEHLRELQRLDRGRVPRHVAEIIFHRAAVDGELRRTSLNVNARNRLAPAAGSVKLFGTIASQRIWRRTQLSSSNVQRTRIRAQTPIG